MDRGGLASGTPVAHSQLAGSFDFHLIQHLSKMEQE
jgi:hypothetical protein